MGPITVVYATIEASTSSESLGAISGSVPIFPGVSGPTTQRRSRLGLAASSHVFFPVRHLHAVLSSAWKDNEIQPMLA